MKNLQPLSYLTVTDRMLSQRSVARQSYPLSSSLFKVLTSVIRPGKEIKGVLIRKEEINSLNLQMT